ncbi:MAG: glycoside hydrolase family 44 protein [Gemmataceae bacterium]|nr:glycoside hydrolase family 44 protein [Gemmataceae bacterium]
MRTQMNGHGTFVGALIISACVGMFLLGGYDMGNAGIPYIDSEETNSCEAKSAELKPLVVWHANANRGKTWEKAGPEGGLSFSGKGRHGEGAALKLTFMGQGLRLGGLNWKGWQSEQGGDDVSHYSALAFYIRQTTSVSNADLIVTLADSEQRDHNGPSSAEVSVRNVGGIDKIDGEWRRVVLPLRNFLLSRSLNLKKVWGINFANKGEEKHEFLIDQIEFTNEEPPLPRFPSGKAYHAKASVSLDGSTHTISEAIYGVVDMPLAKQKYYGIAMSRWGGNTTSRYNWKINADNGAADWFWKNRGSPICDPLEAGFLKKLDDNYREGIGGYLTVPMLGKVAKDHSSYSYSVKKFGEQQSTEPGHPDVGNGKDRLGRTIWGANWRDTSIEVGPDFVAEAVRIAVDKLDRSKRIWVLDNEVMLWHKTHFDVRNTPVGYDEFWELTVRYAEAIRKVDPKAKIAGFCSWGWVDLFYSALDEGADSYRTAPDRQKHGGEPLAVWYLKKCAEYKAKNGKPLIDIFDIHWYPQKDFKDHDPYLDTGMNLELNQRRLRSTRDLWDAQYEPETWTKHACGGGAVKLIPRVKEWIEKYNPGMELCLGEYNFGGADNITGALAQADVFGVLAREKVDYAFHWKGAEGSQEAAWKIYRNYDGQGGRFGEIYLPSQSYSPDLGVYAAKRMKDQALTIVLVNRNLGGACELDLSFSGATGKAKIYQFDQANRFETISLGKVTGGVKLTLPAASASILVIEKE